MFSFYRHILKFKVVLLLWFPANPVFAHEGVAVPKVDSLVWQLAISPQDSIFLRISFEIADKLLFTHADSCLFYVNNAMKRADNGHFIAYYAKGLNYLGIVASHRAHYITALENYQKALTLYRKLGDLPGQANITNNIGVIYTSLDEHEKAIEHYRESYRLNRNLERWGNAALSLLNIAGDYLALGEVKEANNYLAQLDNLHELHPETVDGSAIRGEILISEAQYDDALLYFEKANVNFTKLGDVFMIASNHLNMARCYLHAAEHDLCKEKLDFAEAICKQNEYNELLLEVINERFQLLKSQGYFVQACRVQEEYVGLKDSLDQINRFNRISELNTRYESEKNQAEIAKQQQQILEKNTLITSSLIGTGALVLISGLILWNLLKKRKLNAQLKNQNSQIRLQRQKIISSLNYAKKIQRSILVPEEIIKESLPQSFIFFKPKDIVSGDFYWFKKQSDKLVLATVDCTGHGVPGAFMSLIAHSQLEKSVAEKHLDDPGDIMKFVHNEILQVLNQDKGDRSVQDGLDISICVIDKSKNIIRFAGSGNSIYLAKDNTLQELKTENYGLAGEFFARKSTHTNAFQAKEISYEPGTDLFMFTDGYLDQFGGNDRKKLNKARFRELLLILSRSGLQNGQQQCERFFESWRGAQPQLDDVLVIGARL